MTLRFNVHHSIEGLESEAYVKRGGRYVRQLEDGDVLEPGNHQVDVYLPNRLGLPSLRPAVTFRVESNKGTGGNLPGRENLTEPNQTYTRALKSGLVEISFTAVTRTEER